MFLFSTLCDVLGRVVKANVLDSTSTVEILQHRWSIFKEFSELGSNNRERSDMLGNG